ncbi:MAG: hypothetical protein IJ772_05015 [Bacilli bacterium]|nr:hypothetical protein [Bacilli bacterium]
MTTSQRIAEIKKQNRKDLDQIQKNLERELNDLERYKQMKMNQLAEVEANHKAKVNEISVLYKDGKATQEDLFKAVCDQMDAIANLINEI